MCTLLGCIIYIVQQANVHNEKRKPAMAYVFLFPLGLADLFKLFSNPSSS